MEQQSGTPEAPESELYYAYTSSLTFFIANGIITKVIPSGEDQKMTRGLEDLCERCICRPIVPEFVTGAIQGAVISFGELEDELKQPAPRACQFRIDLAEGTALRLQYATRIRRVASFEEPIRDSIPDAGISERLLKIPTIPPTTRKPSVRTQMAAVVTESEPSADQTLAEGRSSLISLPEDVLEPIIQEKKA